MSRYIDADVLNECMSIVQKANRDSIEFNKRCNATDVFQDIWGMIKAQPTADAKPVVKAKWLDDLSSDWVCTNCLEPSPSRLYKYCPNCGAEMEL